MTKKLEEMSLEELWQIFPIFLVKHNDEWKNWYKEESDKITSLMFANYIERISHIGSTAISQIWSKNIIDILLEVKQGTNLENIKEILTSNGWLCMSYTQNRITLNKGYTEQGFAKKVYHLHIRIIGDNDELYFRDYLNEYHEVAKEYEKLKLLLWKKYEHNRDGYTNAKSQFIEKYTGLAKIKYQNRY